MLAFPFLRICSTYRHRYTHDLKGTFDDQCYQELPDYWDNFFESNIESPGTDVKLYYGHG